MKAEDKEVSEKTKMKVMEKMEQWGEKWCCDTENMKKIVAKSSAELIIYVDGGAKQLKAEDVLGPAWAPSAAWGNALLANCEDENVFLANMCGPVVTKDAPHEI